MHRFKAIIWDYNGTLLNDVEIGVESINTMLQKRQLPLLTCESYREVFTFPVKDYYEKVGFNFQKEDWNSTAHEFIANYTQRLPNSDIFPEARLLLDIFKNQGKKQFILSAMEMGMLIESTKELAIQQFFTEISGIDNIYASSKIDNGKNLFNKYQLKAEDVCLLGDTTHDYEVAQELGCHCYLIASGHQSFEKLKATGCQNIIHSLNDILTE
ncbi:HAD family hydrolase [Ancylomarina salipaludis]|uniref:phosphoglycolate phosphatase n=1 Tax=Ancylomarina salipaludis TaxID=2501299 RepID=A0A4Q1JPY6_9BACT|nr:HAD hydrolase-like protein [Ancylomarina salipaludis]RXQ96526.1 HAD family hydrolase [Ancylomarina salipaludis]